MDIEMKATKEQAIRDIQNGDYEIVTRSRNNKRRNCIFCGENIPKDTEFAKNYEYPYMKNLPRWFACMKCFNKIPHHNPYKIGDDYSERLSKWVKDFVENANIIVRDIVSSGFL